MRSFASLVGGVMMMLIYLQLPEPNYKVLVTVIIPVEKSLGDWEQILTSELMNLLERCVAQVVPQGRRSDLLAFSSARHADEGIGISESGSSSKDLPSAGSKDAYNLWSSVDSPSQYLSLFRPSATKAIFSNRILA